ncbi:zinc finger protein OZF-like [Clytia hemisphaerica]|uniref:zinc finger protein OZF-like n=1 Tax=Clytia hemisphaerica TaxID=252671 RepID=UPI0034D52FEF
MVYPIPDFVLEKDPANYSNDDKQTNSICQTMSTVSGNKFLNCSIPMKEVIMSISEDNQTRNLSTEPSKLTTANKEMSYPKGSENNSFIVEDCQYYEKMSNKPFHCTLCGKRFQFFNNLIAHSRFHTKNSFEKNVNDIKIHKQDVPKKKSVDTQETSDIKQIILNNTESKYSNINQGHVQSLFMKCKDQVFVDKRSSQGQLKCDICGKSYLQLFSLQKHMLTHSESQHRHHCANCGKKFDNRRLFKDHLKSGGCEKPYECTVCGRRFSVESSLSKHSAVHLEENSFNCNLCGKGFKVISNLRKHFRVHTGNKPFKCHVCAKAFEQSSNLQVHLRIHTGERPHKCTVCGKAFKQAHHLKRHHRIHTGEKPFECNVCGKTFNQSAGLKTHLRIHIAKDNI